MANIEKVDTHFCPLLKRDCLKEKCALWVDFDKAPSGNANCSFAHIAASLNCIDYTLDESEIQVVTYEGC